MLREGYVARVVHGDRITFAVVEVEPDAELPEHSHENEQFGMVIQGSVTFRVGDESRTLEPGGLWRIAENTPHSVKGGAEGAVVLDVFTPAREDWKGLPTQGLASARWP
jgi:quercetin dioxygenase-like cupin family protein